MPPEASPRTSPSSVTPQGSSAPLISAEQRSDASTEADETDGKDKGAKRRFFGLGKKKDEKKEGEVGSSTTADSKMLSSRDAAAAASMPPPASPGKAGAPGELKPHSHLPQPIPIPSSRHPYPSMAAAAASPSRLRSGSPRLHSPASSEIFERNVQEPVAISALQGENNTEAHIPSHVMTEDHIPPALEASAQAITSEELNPDEVEIVMSASHQPAASVLEGSSSHADLTSLQSPMPPLSHVASEASEPATSPLHQSGTLHAGDDADPASSYGQLDPNDVRRLSFISFADVVQSEHAAAPGSTLSDVGNRESLHIASLPSLHADGGVRAASPLRSPRYPASTQSRKLSGGGGGGGVTTPPPGTSGDGPILPGSPGSPPPASELTIETMRQAVRKTASGDLSGRSGGMSPVSDEVGGSRSRTNS